MHSISIQQELSSEKHEHKKMMDARKTQLT